MPGPATTPSGGGTAAAVVTPASLDPVREAAAWEAVRAHKLLVENDDRGWYARSAKGEAFEAPSRGYADPVEAVEAALTAMQVGEQRDVAALMKEALDALSAGVYAAWPTAPNTDGEFAWRVLRTADRTVAGGPFASYRAAVREIVRLMREGGAATRQPSP